MVRPLALASLLAIALPCLASAQDGHVWSVNELRAHPGEEAAYTQALQEFDIPIIEEVIRLGGAVSQTLLIKTAGNMQNGTHLLIIEYASWEDYIGVDALFDQAARNLFGRPYADLAAVEYMSRRDVIRRELYRAP